LEAAVTEATRIAILEVMAVIGFAGGLCMVVLLFIMAATSPHSPRPTKQLLREAIDGKYGTVRSFHPCRHCHGNECHASDEGGGWQILFCVNDCGPVERVRPATYSRIEEEVEV
jgi:hypothetical protein